MITLIALTISTLFFIRVFWAKTHRANANKMKELSSMGVLIFLYSIVLINTEDSIINIIEFIKGLDWNTYLNYLVDIKNKLL